MVGKWKVIKNSMMGDTPFAIVRVKDESKPMHGGNLEYWGGYFADKKVAQNIADKINEKETV